MVRLDDVLSALSPRTARILQYVQLAVSAEKFDTARKLVLDELGNSGLMGDLKRLDSESDSKARNGQANKAKKGG